MKYWVGVTDNDWYHYLAERKPDEVNFWRPGGGQFRAIRQYKPFLFKLHSPYNFIVGGGFFVRSTELPLSLAWDVFLENNGAETQEDFYQKIKHYRDQRGNMTPNPIIGCIVLTQPFFFPEKDWIPIPEDWAANIVRGRIYDTEDVIGNRLWDQIQIRLKDIPIESGKTAVADKPRFGEEYLVKPRLGQGGFRIVVTDAYNRQCAMTGEKALPVLQASHIKPYAKSGPHDIQNGLLLRADLHILFDQGYLTVTKDHNIEASNRMKDDFGNGKDYLKLHGQQLNTLPSNLKELPSLEYLNWHQDNVYRG